jgi:putative iron-regulated protein
MPHLPVNLRAHSELERRFQIQLARVGWLLVGLSLSCAPVGLPDGERRVALRGATEKVILPTYAELSARSAELASLLDGLSSTPADADLVAIRRAYREVRVPLEESAAFGFGPAVELHAEAGIDQSPLDVVKLEAELASDNELTLRAVRGLGANKRGLHAIEYLLFPEADAELQAALLADDVGGERRRRFASVAAQIVVENAEALRAAWDPEMGGYARRFAEPGKPDSVSANVQAGLDTLLNETVVLSETIANIKLGKPLGSATGGKIDVTAQESERAGASLTDIASNLRGIRNIYYGARDDSAEPNFSRLVRAKSPSADLHAREALDAAAAAIAAIPEPFTDALNDSPETVSAAFDTLKALKRVLATEVLSSLGGSLKFSDNDGD